VGVSKKVANRAVTRLVLDWKIVYQCINRQLPSSSAAGMVNSEMLTVRAKLMVCIIVRAFSYPDIESQI